MSANNKIIMQKGCLRHEVSLCDVKRWVGFGYVAVNDENTKSVGNEDAVVECESSTTKSEKPKTKRGTARKKAVPENDKS